MLFPPTGAHSLSSDAVMREIKKLGEVAFPAQVRSDTYYFYSAAYFYSGSVAIVAFAVPLNILSIKTLGYKFRMAFRDCLVTEVLRN